MEGKTTTTTTTTVGHIRMRRPLRSETETEENNVALAVGLDNVADYNDDARKMLLSCQIEVLFYKLKEASNTECEMLFNNMKFLESAGDADNREDMQCEFVKILEQTHLNVENFIMNQAKRGDDPEHNNNGEYSDNENNVDKAMRMTIVQKLMEINAGARNFTSFISVINDKLPLRSLHEILRTPQLNAFAPQLRMDLVLRHVVSLVHLCMRCDNLIGIRLDKVSAGSTPQGEILNLPNLINTETVIRHDNDEFVTFCYCKRCQTYRQVVYHMMMEHFHINHIGNLLIDKILKAYQRLIKNKTAQEFFDHYMSSNTNIYWLASSFSKRLNHMNFIYDESINDNMIFVLFSTLLLASNPMLLLQILSYHVSWLMKSYCKGIAEITAETSETPEQQKPIDADTAEEYIKYVLNGYQVMGIISDEIAPHFFTLESAFLNKFELTWRELCERLYYRHVYVELSEQMEKMMTKLRVSAPHIVEGALGHNYNSFIHEMVIIERKWTDVWIKMHHFNLSEGESKRREGYAVIHNNLSVLVEDAIVMNIPARKDDRNFYEFIMTTDPSKGWRNVMAYARNKWPTGFSDPPNVLVCNTVCTQCKELLSYHERTCLCVTCVIGGAPYIPLACKDNMCEKCSLAASGQPVDKAAEPVFKNYGEVPYHCSWIIFKHLRYSLDDRERYVWPRIIDEAFCVDCNLISCRLARYIMDNKISKDLCLLLMDHYQPISVNRNELRALMPNIMRYNYRMCKTIDENEISEGCNILAKAYWTLVLSIYASYFIDTHIGAPLDLSALCVKDNDIEFDMKRLVGNPNDRRFEVFLRKLTLPKRPMQKWCTIDYNRFFDSRKLREKLDEIMKMSIYEMNNNTKLAVEMIESKKFNRSPRNIVAINSRDVNQSIGGEHPLASPLREQRVFLPKEIVEGCKDFKCKKRNKKKFNESNQIRINETRDRLRKKLTKIGNGEKAQPPALSGDMTPITVQPTGNYDTFNGLEIPPQRDVSPQDQHQPPTLKEAASAAAQIDELIMGKGMLATTTTSRSGPSKQDIQELCERMSILNESVVDDVGISKTSTTQTPPKPATTTTLVPVAATNNDKTKSKHMNVFNKIHHAPRCFSYCSRHASSSSSPSTTTTSSSPVIQRVVSLGTCAEIVKPKLEPIEVQTTSDANITPIDKNSADYNKWIKETLNFIEGNGIGSTSNANQVNPKKAAKKEKQKLKKEEGKRIDELQTLRDQFHDIFYKEYTEKEQLKQLKNNNSNNNSDSSSKMRDKKSIQELEANIKKLHAAKGKMEQNILELIATVKQTNCDFKFAYLPSREQLANKLHEQQKLSFESQQQQPQQHNNSNNNQQQQGSLVGHKVKLINPAFLAAGLPPPMTADPAVLRYAPGCIASNMIYAPPVISQQQTQPSFTNIPLLGSSKTNNNNGSGDGDSMFTIRWVNNSNAQEPQVSITRKGTPPSAQDPVYTVSNGQFKPTPPTLLPSSLLSAGPQQQDVLKQQKQQPQKINMVMSRSQFEKKHRQLTIEHDKSAAEIVELERQFQIQLNELRKACEPVKETKDKLLQAKNQKKKKKPLIVPQALTVSPSPPPPASPIAVIKMETETASVSPPPPPPTNTATTTTKPLKSGNSDKLTKILSRKQLKQQQKQLKKAKLKEQQEQEEKEREKREAKEREIQAMLELKNKAKLLKESKKVQLVKVREKKLKPRTKQTVIINNGQFDNNPYKFLHTNESDNFSSASEFESSDDEEENDDAIAACEKQANQGKLLHEKKSQNSKIKDKQNKKSNKKDKTSTTSTLSTNIITSSNNITNSLKSKKLTTTTATKYKNTNSILLNNNNNNNNNRDEKCNNNNNDNISKKLIIEKKIVPTAAVNKKPIDKKLQNNNTINNNNTKNNKKLVNVPDSSNLTLASNQKTKRKEKLPTQQQPQQHEADIASAFAVQRHQCTLKQQQPQQQQQQQHEHSYNHVTQQMQQLRLGSTKHTYDSHSNNSCVPPQAGVAHNTDMANNPSMMEQLTRGVQFEHLSLPPGITLTRIDDEKSEQLRQKSESIKKLSQPLTTHVSPNPVVTPTTSQHGAWSLQPTATIIAPPVSNCMGNTLPYIVPAKTACAYRSGSTSNNSIIMVESAPNHQPPTVIATEKSKISKKKNSKSKTIADDHVSSMENDGKGSKKNRKNRKKLMKPEGLLSAAAAKSIETPKEQPKMITLRNPIFYPPTGASTAPTPTAVALAQQQLQNKDHQPAQLQQQLEQHGVTDNTGTGTEAYKLASIVQNENGMYTIRHPELHQAVSNGLARSGYNQLCNVNYYTPKQALSLATASATGSTSSAKSNGGADTNPPFSYFSKTPTHVVDETTNKSAHNLHNNINISCTSIGGVPPNETDGFADAVKSQPKHLSAIGSEMKQLKQKGLENGATSSNWMQNCLGFNSSHYYNGINTFIPGVDMSSNANSALYVDIPKHNDCHMSHHSCGDDSPPPTITGFTSTYLDDIPNTGVIRYDDASFLKHLIPGRNLNNEVSIHNISEANYNRNASPATPHVELTPVYDRTSTTNLYDLHQQPSNLNGRQDKPLLMNNSNNFANTLSTSFDSVSAFEAVDLPGGLGLSGLFNNKANKSTEHTGNNRQSVNNLTQPYVFEANTRNTPTINSNGWW